MRKWPYLSLDWLPHETASLEFIVLIVSLKSSSAQHDGCFVHCGQTEEEAGFVLELGCFVIDKALPWVSLSSPADTIRISSHSLASCPNMVTSNMLPKKQKADGHKAKLEASKIS